MIVRPVLCRAFIGRREELAYLHQRRLEAGSSRGGLVWIAGNAGLGKSRLVAEFRASLASSRWRVGVGQSAPFAGRPYGPVLEALARIDGTFDLVAASKGEQIDAIAARFAKLAARRGLLVIVEDVHWADVATLDMLAHLAARLHTMRALVLMTFRPDDLHPDHPATTAIAKMSRATGAGRIDLVPFAGAELRRFIDEALDGLALPAELRDAVARAAEGNPFYTEELLKSAVERLALQSDERALDLPQTLRAALLERMRPFDARERRILAQAAVIGRRFDLDLLATTLDMQADQILAALRRARDFQLIEELGPMRFRFRHGLTREAIYGGFLQAELQPLHRTVALALEASPQATGSTEGLAYHWWATGDRARSARYNELAGDEAARVHAHDDAIAFYERALEGDDLDGIRRASLLQKLAARRFALARTEDAHATYTAAADTFGNAGDHQREAACRLHAAILAYTAGMPVPTGPLEAMLTRLKSRDWMARSRVHLGLAWLAATFGFPSRATHHLKGVDERACRAAVDIRLRFHNVAAWVAMTVGDLDAFRREHAAWIDAACSDESVRRLAAAHANGAMCFTFFGLHRNADENLEKAAALARELRNDYVDESVSAFAAFSYLMRGDLERARTSVESIATTTENHINLAFAIAWGTLVGTHLDDRDLIEKWYNAFKAAPSRTVEIECGAGLAEVLVSRGRPHDAAALLHRALPVCEIVRGNVPTLLAVGRYGAPEDRERARAYLAKAADAPVETPERPALVLFDALECRRGGDDAQAARLAAEAAAGFERLGLPLLEAAALESAGRIDDAVALYKRCGARGDIRRLAGEVLAIRPGAKREPGAGVALSGREREIALLAVGGESNLAIARKLSITHKTVEKHLNAVYRKLGVSSRRQLASSWQTLQ